MSNQDMGTLPSRVNDLEKKLHTLEHRSDVLEKAFEGIPSRVILIEHQVMQLKNLEHKIDQQAESLADLKFVVVENGLAVKRYVAYISGAGAVLIFLISYGDKILKLLGRGVF